MASIWSTIDPVLRATVTKSQDARLVEEVKTALPTLDIARIEALSRDELIYNVCLIRRQLNTVNTAQTAATDKTEFANLFVKTAPPVGAASVTNPVASTSVVAQSDMLAQMLALMQQQQQAMQQQQLQQQ